MCFNLFNYLGVFLLFYGSYVQGKKNVLMIISDDLRPQLGCYEGPDFPSPVSPAMKTPNIDGLAKKSALFTRAYSQYALCSPSRTSYMTSRRPSTVRVRDNTGYWREIAGNFSTIPQYFKSQGYRTAGMGKIFHPGAPSNNNDPISWTEPFFDPPSYEKFWRPIARERIWFAINDTFEDTVSPLEDTEIADHAIETIKNLTNDPFFIAVGFVLPHTPFVAPKRFLDLYPLDDVGLPPNAFTPYNFPSVHWSNSWEMKFFADIRNLSDIWTGRMNTTLPDSVVRDIRRAYYASVSFMDFQVGRVLQALNESGQAENTVVFFGSDHGYHLGENALWNKLDNMELATHVPLMIHVPGITNEGIKLRNLVENTDIFPTLASVAGLPPVQLCPEDSSQTEVCTEGSDLTPLITNPESPWKDRVFSQISPRGLTTTMGYSVRTDTFRFTEFYEFDPETYEPYFNISLGVEIYDRENDPQENTNLVEFSNWAEKVTEMRELLQQGWRAALPQNEHSSKKLDRNTIQTLQKFDSIKTKHFSINCGSSLNCSGRVLLFCFSMVVIMKIKFIPI